MQAAARKLSFYISVDYDWLDDPKVTALTGWAFKLMFYLDRYADGKRLDSGWTIPVSHAKLAEKVNCCVSSIQKYIKELQAAGFIKAKDGEKMLYQTQNSPRQPLPRGSVNFTDINNIRLNNITNPPTIASITNSNLDTKKGEGKFNKVKEALKAKDDSYIPPDKQIQEVIEQIPHDKAQESLIYAIRSVDIPRIANLPKLFDAARKKEGEFWKLIKGYPEYIQAEERSKQNRQKTRQGIERGKGPDQSEREPERKREKPVGIDKDRQRVTAALHGFGKGAAKPVTKVETWEREDAIKRDKGEGDETR